MAVQKKFLGGLYPLVQGNFFVNFWRLGMSKKLKTRSQKVGFLRQKQGFKLWAFCETLIENPVSTRDRAEPRTHNPLVPGSSPGGPTNSAISQDGAIFYLPDPLHHQITYF